MNNTKDKPQSGANQALSDTKIIESWLKNAGPWISAISDEQIESRKLITNKAILDAIDSYQPKSVLDIGCGEGWLANRLASNGIDVLGTDVVPELITKAATSGRGRFQVLSYEDMAAGKLVDKFDAAVCNFALLGNESVQDLFGAAPLMLKSSGVFIVQTIHPLIGCGELPYVDGWRKGSWAGFSSDFTDPAPWYFRTLESWIRLFVSSGFSIVEIREPLHPKSQKPASIIFIGKTGG